MTKMNWADDEHEASEEGKAARKAGANKIGKTGKVTRISKASGGSKATVAAGTGETDRADDALDVVEGSETVDSAVRIRVIDPTGALGVDGLFGTIELRELSDEESKSLSAEDRKVLAQFHTNELKKLNATPRSDWHAAFEATLRAEAYKFGNRVNIAVEVEIGIMPPRVDFLILQEFGEVDWDKEIFRVFRRFNILEYKSPEANLNERTIRKVIGYCNLYLANAEHEGDRPSNELSASIFRAKRPDKLFDAMMAAGTLVPDEEAGIYHVVGLCDFPFQIVITSELEGEKNAPYRVLTDDASLEDVKRVAQTNAEEKDEVPRNFTQVLLDQVYEKNPKLAEMLRKDKPMRDTLMELLRDRVDEEKRAATDALKQELTVSYIQGVMASFGCDAERAMDAMGIDQSERDEYTGLVGAATK